MVKNININNNQQVKKKQNLKKNKKIHNNNNNRNISRKLIQIKNLNKKKNRFDCI